jgi:hypothetical protein
MHVIGVLIIITVIIFGFGVALMTGVGSHEQWAGWRHWRRRREPAAKTAPQESAPEVTTDGNASASDPAAEE